MPKRFQLRRVKGYRKPEGGVVCTRASRWGNPWRVRVKTDGTAVAYHPGGLGIMFTSRAAAAKSAIACFESDLRHGLLNFTVDDVKRELRGKDLGCFCPLPEPGETDLCHAAALLRIANGGA